MAVETLSEFPASFIAGDTLRATISDSDYPSTLWGLKVLLQSGTVTKAFAATAVGGSSTAYSLVISAGDSAKIVPGLYVVSFIYTETATSERQTGEDTQSVMVYANPEGAHTKSIARQTLEAMEEAFLKLAKGINITFQAGGHSYTHKNMKELQEAIERQRAIVNAEEGQLSGHCSIGRILHPL